MNDLATPSSFSLVPRTMEEAIHFSTTLAKSDIVPKDFQSKPANILVAIQWGMELGLQPMQAMQSIAVINGRPSLWGDAVLGLVMASNLAEYVREEISEDGSKATCRTKRKGDGQEHVRTFTMADAEKAGLKGKQGPWTQYPKRMLQMRARSWCMRDVYPDVLRGVHVTEEAQDIPAERDITGESQVVEQPRSKKAADKPASQETVDQTTGEVTREASPAVEKPEAAAAAQPQGAAAAGEQTQTGKPVLEGQLRIIRAKLRQNALTDADLIAKFGRVEDLRFEQYDEIINWIAERASK